MLPGGLRRFVPCSIGANHCRLRHIGWEKCGHGLTSRPRESASDLFLNELLSLFRYPPQSGRALLNGTLPLRYCAVRFAHSTPTWRLPASGQVSRLVAAYPESAGDSGDPDLVCRVPLVSRSSPFRKRFRLNRKTPAHLVGMSAHSRSRVWKRLRQVGYSDLSMPDHTRRRCDHAIWDSAHEHDRVGVGWFPWNCAGPRLQVCTPFQLASAVGLHDYGAVDIHTLIESSEQQQQQQQQQNGSAKLGLGQTWSGQTWIWPRPSNIARLEIRSYAPTPSIDTTVASAS